MAQSASKIAVVTGASAGIGAATARVLARDGFRPLLGARRLDRLEELAAEVGGKAFELDVTDPASIETFARSVEAESDHVDLLVNNAGLARGLGTLWETDDRDWVEMIETNVLGLLRVSKAFVPMLRRAPHGHIVNLGSIAAFETYRGGAGYTATKHAVRAITRTLRIELNGEPIRVSEVSPGMVETEFSVVRYRGDAEKAKGVYSGFKPLSPEDIAEVIAFVVSRPPHVDIDEVVIRPIAQANAYTVARSAT